MKKQTDFNAYLQGFDKTTQDILIEIRDALQQTLPDAELAFSYGIPTYKVNGKNIIHFAGYKAHIGLYPGSRAMEYFKPQLSSYHTSKGTIQLPLDKPMPMDLITDIAKKALELNI